MAANESYQKQVIFIAAKLSIEGDKTNESCCNGFFNEPRAAIGTLFGGAAG